MTWKKRRHVDAGAERLPAQAMTGCERYAEQCTGDHVPWPPMLASELSISAVPCLRG